MSNISNRERARRLVESWQMAGFAAAEVLERIQSTKAYEKWGFRSFNAYIREDHEGISVSQIRNLCNIYRVFAREYEYTPEYLVYYGTSKLVQLHRLVSEGVITAKNVEGWLTRTESLTVAQTAAMVDALKKPGENAVGASAAEVKKMLKDIRKLCGFLEKPEEMHVAYTALKVAHRKIRSLIESDYESIY